MTTEGDTPMTPAAPVVDERQKALDKYTERLLEHRCLLPRWRIVGLSGLCAARGEPELAVDIISLSALWGVCLLLWLTTNN